MNAFYGFVLNLENGILSDSIVTDDETMNAIPSDRYSVSDIPVAVKCMPCSEYMVLQGKIEGNAEAGNFVCPRCVQSLPQRHVFEKLSEEIKKR